jgi:hypothetical protein
MIVKLRWYSLVLAAGTGIGCVWLPQRPEEEKPLPPPPQAAAPVKPKRPPALVTPDQVQEGNAHEVGKALWDELDRDSQAEEAPPAAPK